jgi:hypothetical protein
VEKDEINAIKMDIFAFTVHEMLTLIENKLDGRFEVFTEV